MTIVLGVIAVLIAVTMVYVKKFMTDMAAVESDLIRELREIKGVLLKINEKQLS